MQNKVILKIRAGSHLYGLNTENSDEDFIGVYLNTADEMYGLQSSEIIEENVVSKHEDSNRNTKDAVDCKYYELRRFCNLLLNANPTILELLFANPENILECNSYGQSLIDNRSLFLSTKVLHSYLGYAHSQVAKSQVKSKNLRTLVLAREYFTNLVKQEQPQMLYQLISDDMGVWGTNGNKIITFDENYPDYAIVADIKLNNQKIGDVLHKINTRLDKASHRADGMLKDGLDFKFVSHTLRLIKEGEELLTTGNLVFPLKDRELLLKIKQGEMKPTEVMDLIGDINALHASWKELESPLPHKPDFHAVNNLVINIYKNYLLGEVN